MNFEVQVLVNGRQVEEYCKDGRIFIEGRPGSKYSLRVKNNSNSRILAVPTIDGLSVIDGKEAGYDSRGYIIGKYSSVTIDGWRTSDETVAEFCFSSPEDSYVKKGGGDTKNKGVIGVAIFYEKDHIENWIDLRLEKTRSHPRPPFYPYWFATDNTFSSTHTTVTLSCSGILRSPEQKVGTGFGKEKESRVEKVEFDRNKRPVAVFEILYNTREELEKMGVIQKNRTGYISPSAFPKENEYCKRPK